VAERQLGRTQHSIYTALPRCGLRADVRLSVRAGGALRVRHVRITRDEGPAGSPRRARGPQELRDATLGDAIYVERRSVRVSPV
jgi:hypothetical protein